VAVGDEGEVGGVEGVDVDPPQAAMATVQAASQIRIPVARIPAIMARHPDEAVARRRH